MAIRPVARGPAVGIEEITCTLCDGDGQALTVICPRCHGSGKIVPRSKRVLPYIAVPRIYARGALVTKRNTKGK